MTTKMKLLGAVSALALTAMAVDANAATSFQLGTPGVTQSLGSGWGSGPGVLGATFTLNAGTLNGLSFSLNPGQTSASFGFANVSFSEAAPAGDDNIDSSELDALGVSYTFNLNTPDDVNHTLTANGVATLGQVSDGGIDLIIDFSPLLVNFGVGGQYIMNVSDLIFSNNGQTQPVSLSFQLVSDSQNVPEPMTLGLLGAGLLGMGIAARRRRS